MEWRHALAVCNAVARWCVVWCVAAGGGRAGVASGRQPHNNAAVADMFTRLYDVMCWHALPTVLTLTSALSVSGPAPVAPLWLVEPHLLSVYQ